MNFWNLALFLLIGGSWAGAWAAPAPVPAKPTAAPTTKPSAAPQRGVPAGGQALSAQLEAAMLESEKSLGALEPWQKRIFVEEAVPQYQRFIRDYRRMTHGIGATATTSMAVDIDYDSLRDYLRFYAPKVLKREKPQILVALKPGSGCPKCAESLPSLKKLVQERLDRRGLVPVFVEIPESEQAIEARLDHLAQEKKTVGALALVWEPVAADEDNGAHADEERFNMQSVLMIRELSTLNGRMEIQPGGSFERVAARLLTDAFTQVGQKSEKLEIRQSELKKTEIQLTLSGFTSYPQYAAAKAKIEERLKAIASIEERKISRGKVMIAVFTEKTVEQVRAALGKLEDPALQVEIQ